MTVNKHGFVMISNALLTHYNFFPKFNGNTLLVYAYLKKLENAQWGYAFPSQNQAMSDLGISDATFKAQVQTLVECGLVEVRANHDRHFANNVYYLNEPIEDASTFYATFPQAKAEYDRKQATAAKVGRSRRKARKQLTEKISENEASASVENTGIGDSYSELDGWF